MKGEGLFLKIGKAQFSLRFLSKVLHYHTVSLFFANPLGLLALLGVPVLLAIYFFQRQSRQFYAPTMFLIKNQFEHRTGGRQFKRFQPSWPLLLQLLSILLLALLLAQPRVKGTNVTQKVGVVLDASASMSAFKEEVEKEVGKVFQRLGKEKSAFSIQLFSSLPESAVLYSGDSPEETLNKIKEWQPTSGKVDPTSALNLARIRIGENGLLLYVTDHAPERGVSEKGVTLAVGRALNNVGFCGVSVKNKGGESVAQALVKNYGKNTEKRGYEIQTASGEVLGRKEVSLTPGQVKTLTFPFTAERDQLCFSLTPDEFPLDDTAPVLRPKKKSLLLRVSAREKELKKLGEKLHAVMQSSPPETGIPADVIIQSQPAEKLTLPLSHSINFISPAKGRKVKIRTESLIPAASPLTRDLVWDTLLVPETPGFTPLTRDEVLLWAGTTPLLSLRVTSYGGEIHQHLLCHFPARGSNLQTQGNLGILFYRFMEQLREEKADYFREILEVNQSLRSLTLPSKLTEQSPLQLKSTLHYAPSYQKTVSTRADQINLRLPPEPNIITLTQGEKQVATLATHFADTREADFSAATTQIPETLVSSAEKLNSSKPLPYAFLLILFILLMALFIWALSHRKPTLKPALT